MTINVGLLAVLIFALLMAWLIRYEERVIREQRETINELIELNNSKSEYIDAGCRGRYEGTEEMLPGERNALGGATK
jgi:hypothetical protein